MPIGATNFWHAAQRIVTNNLATKNTKNSYIYRAALGNWNWKTKLDYLTVYGPNTTPRFRFGNQKLASDMGKMKMAPQSPKALLQIGKTHNFR